MRGVYNTLQLLGLGSVSVHDFCGETPTYDLDIVGHPAEEDPLLNSSFPSVSTEQGVVLEHHGELGEAAEEQGGQGGGQEGQVPAEEPFQAGLPFLALENLWKQIFC